MQTSRRIAASFLMFSTATFFFSTQVASAADKVADRSKDPAHIWDTSLLFQNDATFDAAKDKVAKSIPKLKAYQGRLGESAATLLEALDFNYAVRKDYLRLAVYASLRLDENTRNAPALERDQTIDMLGSDLMRAASYFRPEILSVGAEKIRGFIASEPRLGVYRFPLEDILRAAPHTLGAEAEGVMSAASMVTGAPQSVYSILANADLPWPKFKLPNGEEVLLNQSGYTKLRSHPDREVRAAVFHSFWGKLKEYERTMGVSLFSQVKADWFRASVRKYPNSLAAAQSDDNVPEKVYRTLLSETNANLSTLHRYFKLRGRMLGISDLRYHDIYPSLVASDKTFSIDTAKELTISATKPLGAEYVRLISEGLKGRYMHTYPQQGKRSGAYMNGSVYDAHPYVLMNFNDDYESLTTLAHEWGHAMHSRLANLTQPFPVAAYSTYTAEIASTLNEALLLEQMLKVSTNDSERLFYLGSALEGLRGTFFRQTMFAEFELAIHEKVEKGEALTGEKLTQIYGDILRRYHGHDQKVLTIDDYVTIEWAYIPHFYYNFYVYQYATSIAASQAFAEKIVAGQPGAVDTYLGLLKSGGSDYPYELVKKAGVDLASPEPYRALFKRMNRIMDEIEAILKKQGK